MNILRLTTITFSLILLIACGGGGGGGGGSVGGGGAGRITPPPTLEELPALLITNTEQQQAINDFTGAVPSTMTHDQIRGALEREADMADGLLFSDVAILSRGERVDDRSTDCTPGVCIAEIIPSENGEDPTTIEFSLDKFNDPPELNNVPLIGFNQQYDAVMGYREITLAQEQSAGRAANNATFHFQSYGGWLESSVFAVQLITIASTVTLLTSYSFGDVNDPADDPSGTGPATWEGVMVGANQEREVIQGDAAINIDDLSSPSVDVEFTNVVNFNDASDSIDTQNWEWTGLRLADGRFMRVTDDESIEGMFYGETHDEVGGVFDRNNIVGAFGATRRTQ